MNTRSATIWTLALLLASTFLTTVEAQPRRDRRGGGQWRGQAMLRRFLPLEQTIGYLAFDDKIKLKDKQLVKIRKELAPIHEKRGKMAEALREGDRDQIREEMQALTKEMRKSILAVLDDRQGKVLKDYWNQLEEMRERFRGRRGRGGRGGGGSGGV